MNDKRTRKVTVRLTVAEYENLIQKQRNSLDKKFSDYARRLLLGKPVKVISRNHSMDLFIRELIVLRKELNAAGNNFNQVVKRINSIQDLRDLYGWLSVSRKQQDMLLDKIQNIQTRINQFSEQWWQK